jgi:hypothetical protein
MRTRAHTRTPPATAAPTSRPLLRDADLALPLQGWDVERRNPNGACGAVFAAGLQRGGLRHIAAVEVPRADRVLRALAEHGVVELSWCDEHAHDAVLTLPGGPLALLSSHHGTLGVVVAATDPHTARETARALGAALRDEPPGDDRVEVTFWSGAGGGGRASERAVDAPAWAEVERNYPGAVRAAMGRLTALAEPRGGTLVLWHGPPGTGKTHALRALVRAWEPWCAAHYVTDPEALLASPGYLMEVATEEDDAGRPWRLVVLEDAGELMSPAARSEAGQGLSRLLNLTDGLLGQGVRCVLLVTTNEPVGRLHPAVRRPGRALATVEFGPFAPAEATAWLALRGVDRTLGAPATLAELYALADGREPAGDGGNGTRAPFGFGRAAVPA